MSNGGDSAVSPVEAALSELYAQAKEYLDRAAAETALLDLSLANGPEEVRRCISDLQAKARSEADEIAKRLKGESGGDSTEPSDDGPGGAPDLGPGAMG